MKRFFICFILFFISTPLFSQTDDKKLNRFIYDWIDAKYSYGGSSMSGIDCSQFNKKLYKIVYNKDLNNTCLLQWKQTKRITKDKLKVGDLVFFKSKGSPSGWHCGVYIGDSNFVNAANSRIDIQINSLNDEYYKRNFRGAGRL